MIDPNDPFFVRYSLMLGWQDFEDGVMLEDYIDGEASNKEMWTRGWQNALAHSQMLKRVKRWRQDKQIKAYKDQYNK